VAGLVTIDQPSALEVADSDLSPGEIWRAAELCHDWRNVAQCSGPSRLGEAALVTHVTADAPKLRARCPK
jgi:hypothetical protein